MNNSATKSLLFLLVWFGLCLFGLPAWAQQVVTYQGSLKDGGVAATGLYDIQFTLYDAPAGGVVVDGPITREDVPVQDGVFTTQLSFAPGAFNGQDRWLEVALRDGASTGVFQALQPRQAITGTPQAHVSLSVAPDSVGTLALQNGAVTGPKIATGTVGSVELASTMVAAGSYGSATEVGTFTVDADGRLTSAGNQTISGVSPGGAAGGDLTGTYPNPSLAADSVNGTELADTIVQDAATLEIMNGDASGRLWLNFSNDAPTANQKFFQITSGTSQTELFYVDANGDVGIFGTLTATLNGNASTATALASDPSDCGPGTVAKAIAANGNLTCSAVASGEIAADAVGASEIAAGAVGTSEIAVDAVTSNEIAADAVGPNEIAASAVGSTEIAAAAVGTTHLSGSPGNGNAGDLLTSDGAGSFTWTSQANVDAGTLDGIDGTSLLRSDADDTWSVASGAGVLTLGDSNDVVTFNAQPQLTLTAVNVGDNGNGTQPNLNLDGTNPAYLIDCQDVEGCTGSIAGGAVAGRVIVIVSSSSTNPITFSDTGNLKLAGPAMLDASDTLVVIWDGSAWVEISRSSN